MKGEVLLGRARREAGWQGFLGKDEDRDFVFADLVNQVRAGRLCEIGDAPAQQLEAGILKLGQIEGEGNLTLEPWLHGVAVSGDNVDWSSAGEG